MTDLKSVILDAMESDPAIIATDVGVEISPKGFFRRRKLIRIFGSVSSQESKDAAGKIAERHAGDDYDVVNDLSVH